MIEAVVERVPFGVPADLSIGQLSSAHGVILGPGNELCVILKDCDSALTLRLHGSRILLAPVSAIFQFGGLPNPEIASRTLAVLSRLILQPNRQPRRSRDLAFLRDALVALDGRSAGASYREMASIVYGHKAVNTAWSSRSRWMKDRMHRALLKGEFLRDGGYGKLLG